MKKEDSIFTMAGTALLVSTLAISTTGCRDLPGSPEAQGATIGGLSGAAVGAVVGGSDNRLLGALIGGALGAGGGYLIGANKDKIMGRDQSAAVQSVQTAQNNPATAAQARAAATGDVNGDGFVTMDEVVALEKAGFSDREIISRLEATGQVFELTAQQQQFLRDQGVSTTVVRQMPELNRSVRQELLSGGNVISSAPPQP